MNASHRQKLLPLLLAVLILTACGGKASPSSSPSGRADPSPPVIVSPDSSGVSPSPDRGPLSEETFPVPSPVVPHIDWTPNPYGAIGKTSHKQSYTDGGVVMDLTASFPSAPLETIASYYANALEDTVYRCDKLSSEAKSLKSKGVLARPFSYSEDFTVELDTGGLLSIRRAISLDTGGALPESWIICDNFSLSDGRLLTLDNFFTVSQEEYSERLLYSVRQYIRSHENDLFGDASAIASEAFPYDSFCITQSGLSLFYPEMTLAPQSMGVIRIDVPWEVFGDIWKTPQ